MHKCTKTKGGRLLMEERHLSLSSFRSQLKWLGSWLNLLSSKKWVPRRASSLSRQQPDISTADTDFLPSPTSPLTPWDPLAAEIEILIHPDLEFVKKFTRPNFRAKEFYTLKTCKSRLFSPAINSKNASLSIIWPSFGKNWTKCVSSLSLMN